VHRLFVPDAASNAASASRRALSWAWKVTLSLMMVQ